MRIDPEFLRSVAFLCEKDASGTINPTSTAFFISVPEIPDVLDSEDDEWTSGNTSNYVVTARHCIEDAEGPSIYVRVNTHKGRSRDIPTRKRDWICHKAADCAVLLLDDAPSDISIEPIPISIFVGPNHALRVKYRRLGIDNQRAEAFENANPEGERVELGEDIFFLGLFVQDAGVQQNLPIVRFGNIARMPNDELIALETETRGVIQVRAYLAETHSWGGHSGSPVFWHHIMRIPEEFWIRGLLGLVSAHADIEGGFAIHTDEKRMLLNSGIAVITPAADITELLMKNKKVIEQREKQKAERERKRPAATADRAKRTQLTQITAEKFEIPIPTRGQFERDLMKATRKRKPS